MGDAAYRVFSGIADAWNLSTNERVVLLGLGNAVEPGVDSGSPWRDLSPEVLERLSILLSIFHAINTLMPVGARADAWMRAPNEAPLFEGRSAIDLMIADGLVGMRKLRRYLQSEAFG